MKKKRDLRWWLLIGAIVFFSCTKNDVPPPIPDQSFTEEFDTLQSAYDRGWRFINSSENASASSWVQGASFPAYSSKGVFNGCTSADITSTNSEIATISNWAVSPVLTLQNGDKIIFYTRSLLIALPDGDSTDYANRLQVRISTADESLDVGTGVNPGDFQLLLLDINEGYEEYNTHPFLYTPTAYPAGWTRFEATVRNLTEPVKGRFAFRYFIEGGGSNGRGSEVAIDLVSYIGKAIE